MVGLVPRSDEVCVADTSLFALDCVGSVTVAAEDGRVRSYSALVPSRAAAHHLAIGSPRAYEPALKPPLLRRLVLSGVAAGATLAQVLATALRLGSVPHLRQLALDDAGLDDRAMQTLFAAVAHSNNSLAEISLSDNPTGVAGARAIACALSTNTRLTSVKLVRATARLYVSYVWETNALDERLFWKKCRLRLLSLSLSQGPFETQVGPSD